MSDTTSGGFWGRFFGGGITGLFARTDAASVAPALPDARADAYPSSTALQSAVDNGGLTNALSGFGTVNDKGAAARPNTARMPLNERELEALYLYVCRRLVDIVPDDATRKGGSIDDPEVEGHPFTEEDKRLEVWSRLWEADVLSRVFGRSAIWMVVDEEGDPDLSEPLDPEKVTRVHNLVALEKREYAVVDYDRDPKSPRYRQASHYQIAPGGGWGAARWGEGARLSASALRRGLPSALQAPPEPGRGLLRPGRLVGRAAQRHLDGAGPEPSLPRSCRSSTSS